MTKFEELARDFGVLPKHESRDSSLIQGSYLLDQENPTNYSTNSGLSSTKSNSNRGTPTSASYMKAKGTASAINNQLASSSYPSLKKSTTSTGSHTNGKLSAAEPRFRTSEGTTTDNASDHSEISYRSNFASSNNTERSSKVLSLEKKLADRLSNLNRNLSPKPSSARPSTTNSGRKSAQMSPNYAKSSSKNSPKKVKIPSHSHATTSSPLLKAHKTTVEQALKGAGGGNSRYSFEDSGKFGDLGRQSGDGCELMDEGRQIANNPYTSSGVKGFGDLNESTRIVAGVENSFESKISRLSVNQSLMNDGIPLESNLREEADKWKTYGTMVSDNYGELKDQYQSIMKERTTDKRIISALRDQVTKLKELMQNTKERNEYLETSKTGSSKLPETKLSYESLSRKLSGNGRVDADDLKRQLNEMKIKLLDAEETSKFLQRENEILKSQLTGDVEESMDKYKAMFETKLGECTSLAEQVICLRTDLDKSQADVVFLRDQNKSLLKDRNRFASPRDMNSARPYLGSARPDNLNLSSPSIMKTKSVSAFASPNDRKGIINKDAPNSIGKSKLVSEATPGFTILSREGISAKSDNEISTNRSQIRSNNDDSTISMATDRSAPLLDAQKREKNIYHRQAGRRGTAEERTPSPVKANRGARAVRRTIDRSQNRKSNPEILSKYKSPDAVPQKSMAGRVIKGSKAKRVIKGNAAAGTGGSSTNRLSSDNRRMLDGRVSGGFRQ